MDPHDDTVVAWEITDGTGGSLAYEETNFDDGITSNTLTTSTNPGDTYQITGRIKNLVLDPDKNTADDEFRLDVETIGYDKVTGMELVTAIIEVVPGLTDSISVSTSETELKADGTSELTVTATLTDQFGNTVAVDTWVNWNLEGDGELIEIDNTTDASGQVAAKLIAGTAAGNQKVILEADSTVQEEAITNTELTSSITSSKPSLDMATGETATLTASFSGVEDGAPSPGTPPRAKSSTLRARSAAVVPPPPCAVWKREPVPPS
ncbi:MAG: hypothetical protein HC901_01535 [Bdellovibrionaceae bacterium]|nr:hypothetical protein [Pseudobdellovibrionaceae bacterium]